MVGVDDHEVREIVSDMLTEGGYAVRAFASTAEALAADPPIEVDVAILDYIIPGMIGADLALRGRNQRQAILFFSGYSESAELDKLSDERTRLLRKSFSSEELEAAMAAVAAG